MSTEESLDDRIVLQVGELVRGKAVMLVQVGVGRGWGNHGAVERCSGLCTSYQGRGSHDKVVVLLESPGGPRAMSS
jgi:hypothetical protein